MKELVNHLKIKAVNIIITNVCNLSCGGCTQHCGLFNKEQLFFISEEQFKTNISVASEMHKNVHLFGGEACLHPDIEKFLSFSKDYPDNLFFIWTNGKYKKYDQKNIIKTQYTGTSYTHTDYKNVVVQVDHSKEGRFFIPTLVAPKDILYLENKEQYFLTYAQKNCFMWNYCQILFYDKYAYACECAGSFDKIDKFNNGWLIEKNFLDKLNNEDVIKQVSNFCQKCGHCLPKEIKQKLMQKVEDDSLYSISNKEIVKKNNKNILKKLL